MDVAVILAMIPMTSAATTAPMHHPASTQRSNRADSPVTDPSPNRRTGDTSAEARRPSPTSRRPARTMATVVKPTVVTSAGTSGQGSLTVNGRISSVQPKGVAHASQWVRGPASATMRTTKATATTPSPRLVARRRVRPSWEVTAPTAANTAGTSARLSP